jgi:hypothetical protein
MLYKGKGCREDPAKYRGISLISLVEKLLSTIMLKRIQKHADARIMQGQNGFRPLKSCRDAVFRVWREIERSNRDEKAFILTFIDYSKAFDSVEWKNTWKALKFAGCPEKLVRVMSVLYEHSTIAIRLTANGKLAPEFRQGNGIRQGSSLSPLIFILVMDFVIRVFQDACVELGLPSHEETWSAYADDMADRSSTEEEATIALRQLEAASAYVGLRLNVPKTEVMAKGIKKPTDNEKATRDAVKERVEVTFDDGKFEAWKTKAKWAHLLDLGEDHSEKLQEHKAVENSIVLQYEDGEVDFALDRTGGWLRDGDGDSHRVKLLGRKTPLGKFKGFVCEKCESYFEADNERGFKTHQGGKWCRDASKLTVNAQRVLRRTRQRSETKRGKTVQKVEMVNVYTCDEKKTTPCGSFCYLESTIERSGKAKKEIKRRIGMALTTFRSLHKIWKSRSMSRKLKGRLYKCLILSIMLYNAEVWPILKTDLKHLEGAHFRMLRAMMAFKTHEIHISTEDLLSAFNMESITEIITSKRLKWIGHALRRKDNDWSKRQVLKELEVPSSTWTKAVKEDCDSLKITIRSLMGRINNKSEYRRLTSLRTRIHAR